MNETILIPKGEMLSMSEKKENTGLKADQGKPALDLIPKEALWMAGQAFGYGAKKYGQHNFKGGIQHSRLAAAALRHIYQYLAGENSDSESLVSHVGHALASLAMLAYMIEHRPDLDDRHKGSK